MRDKQVRRTGLGLQVLHQVDDLRLNRHVQRADAFVCNDQLRAHNQRAGNADTLALAAAELVRVTVGMLRCKAHLFQHFGHALFALGTVFAQMVDIKALRNNLTHLFAGVQASHRVLKNHLHLGAQLAGLCPAHLAGDIHTAEFNFARGRVVQPDQAAADGAFAAAGFAHKAVGLAGVNFKIHPVNRAHGKPAAGAKILLKAFHL